MSEMGEVDDVLRAGPGEEEGFSLGEGEEEELLAGEHEEEEQEDYDYLETGLTDQDQDFMGNEEEDEGDEEVVEMEQQQQPAAMSPSKSGPQSRRATSVGSSLSGSARPTFHARGRHGGPSGHLQVGRAKQQQQRGRTRPPPPSAGPQLHQLPFYATNRPGPAFSGASSAGAATRDSQNFAPRREIQHHQRPFATHALEDPFRRRPWQQGQCQERLQQQQQQRPAYSLSPPPALPPVQPRLHLSRPNWRAPPSTQLTVDLNAQPSRELGQFASLQDADDDDEIQVIHDGSEIKREELAAEEEDYPYNDVTEDEVSFLERVKEEESAAAEVQQDGPKVFDVPSDDDDCEILEDNDNHIDLKPDVKLMKLEAGPSSLVPPPVDSTGKLLNNRFNEQFAEKLEDINVAAKPKVDPGLFKGRVNVFNLRKALRGLAPDEVDKIIRKRGRCEIVFYDIPSNWNNAAVLRNMCCFYGQVVGVSAGRHKARVVFRHEKSAKRCEREMYNQVDNDKGRKVLVRRRFQLNPC